MHTYALGAGQGYEGPWEALHSGRGMLILSQWSPLLLQVAGEIVLRSFSDSPQDHQYQMLSVFSLKDRGALVWQATVMATLYTVVES